MLAHKYSIPTHKFLKLGNFTILYKIFNIFLNRCFTPNIFKSSTTNFQSSKTVFRLKENSVYLVLKRSDWLCKVVELSKQCCGKLLLDSFETCKKTSRSFERRICAQTPDLQIFKKFIMSQMNPKEVFHNTAYSVELPYIAGHSL